MSFRVKKLDKVTDIVIAAYKNGQSLEVIAAAHGVSKGSVRNFLKANSVVMRKQGRVKGSSKKSVTV